MIKKRKKIDNSPQLASLRTARIGFIFIAIYVASTLIYKLWKLMTPDVLYNRWMITVAILAANLTFWWFSRKPRFAPLYYRGLIILQILMYILVASLSIYFERGMASNAIILYAIPLVIVALNNSNKLLFGTALLCSAAYSVAAIKYFREYPSEGYKVELYGGILYYSAILFVIAALLGIVTRNRRVKT